MSTRGPLARALGTCVSLCAKARGLRRPSSSSCTGLSHAQTPLPPPTRLCGLALSCGVSPALLPHCASPPQRRLPGAAWKTHTARGRWRVALLAPAALGGSPGCGQRGQPVDRCPLCSRRRCALVPPRTARLCCQARLAARANKGSQGQPFPQGFPTLQVMHHVVPEPSTTSRERVSPSWRLSGACCSRHRVVYGASPQGLIGCLYTQGVTTFFHAAFTAHRAEAGRHRLQAMHKPLRLSRNHHYIL